MDTYKLLGQKINLTKSKILFSPRTSPSIMASMENELGISSCRDFGKYLGVPILTNKGNKRAYNFIIDKLHNKLSSWKSKTLSLASRLTLINSITSAIPTYVMQITLLPQRICKEIDQINRNFL